MVDDPIAAARALFAIVLEDDPDGWLEVRVERSKGDQHWPSRYFRDADAAVDYVDTCGACHAVYFGTAPRKRQGGTEDVDTTRTSLVRVDCDTDAALDAAARFPVRPSIVVESGGVTASGRAKRQMYWRLAEPIDAQTEMRTLCERFAAKFASDASMRTAARIMRVPGTWHRKAHPARLVRCVKWSDARVDLADLDALLPPPPPPKETRKPSEAAPWHGGDLAPGVAELVDAVIAKIADETPGASGGKVRDGRRDRVYKAAFAIGGLIAGGELPPDFDTAAALEPAIRACGLRNDPDVTDDQVETQIARGLDRGAAKPLRSVLSELGVWPPRKGEPPVAALLSAFAKEYALDGLDHVLAVLAAAATRELDADPLWLLVVGPSSSSKTEAVRLLDRAASRALDDFTIAGLLGWRKRGKAWEPSGVLADHPGAVLATIADLSTLLAGADRGERDAAYALLRRAYDGHVTRDQQQGRLEWRGRLTLIAAVTPEIDRQRTHAQALGERWVYVRVPDLSDETRRRGLARVRARAAAGNTAQWRRELADTAASVLADAQTRAADVTLGDDLARTVDDAAIIAALVRAHVPRDGYGRRDILDVPVPEEPFRLAAGLAMLARGVLALRLDETIAERLVLRAALDSVPLTRRRVLSVLANGEALTAHAIARASGLNNTVARTVLQDLEAIGLVTWDGADRDDADDDATRSWKPWKLHGDHARLVADLVTRDELTRSAGYTPSLQGESEDESPISRQFANTGAAS